MKITIDSVATGSSVVQSYRKRTQEQRSYSLYIVCSCIYFLIIPSFFSFSQADTTADTVFFENNGKKITVVHTNNRQYYNDSTCIWEVMYPELSGLQNKAVEASINLMFSQEVAFGDCNDKVCDRTTMYFPLLSKYWDKVKITGIKNDVLCYSLSEGHCPVNSNYCSSKTQYRLYNLKNGTEVESSSLFRKDEIVQHKLDSLILEKFNFIPEDMGTVRTERQFYFKENKLFVFYDQYTVSRSETYSFELTYKEIKDWINPLGILPILFEDKARKG